MEDLDVHLWSNILIYLYNHQDEENLTALKMCNAINSTPSSISKNMALLRRERLINFTRKGRVNKVILTSKGKIIAQNLIKIITLLKEDEV